MQKSLSNFLIPENWDESYNTKTKSLPNFNEQLENSRVKWYVEDESKKLGFTGYVKVINEPKIYFHPNYPNTQVIILRDILTVPLITNVT